MTSPSQEGTSTPAPAIEPSVTPGASAPSAGVGSALPIAESRRADWIAEFQPRSRLLDQEALRVYEHAYAIGLQTEPVDDPPITFSTLLIALLAGTDETSLWFKQAASANGPMLDAVLAEKDMDASKLQALSWQPGRPTTVRLSKDRYLLTRSAREVIDKAEQWVAKVGGTDIGVRHLVASYVLNPPSYHRAQMVRWNYHETPWRPLFFEWVGERYTHEQWVDASQRPAPAKAAREIDTQSVKGEALAFPGDESVLAILTKACDLHARTSDVWLRHQTVVCALVASADEDESIRKAIHPMWEAVKSAGADYTTAVSALFASTAKQKTVKFDEVDISPRVLNALETARELAHANLRTIAGEVRVGPMDLAGAVVSRRVDGDSELAGLGLEPQALRIALIEHAHGRGDSAEIWRDALGEEEVAQAGRPLDLNSDEPEAVVRLDEGFTSDPLGIRRDVETFAALLASRNLEPPLSIGLFGPWGSGKTTFLKRLQRAVQRRANEAQSQDGDTPYVRHVVHVDFNAWHFAEDALTSSLVDTVLRKLSDYITQEGKLAGKEWEQLKQKELVSAQRRAEAAQAVEDAAREATNKAEENVAAKRTTAADKATTVASALRRIWTATREAFENSAEVKESGVLAAMGDTVNTAEELRTRVATIRARPARLLADLGWSRTLMFAALVLAVPPAVAWVVAKIVTTSQAPTVLSTVMAALSTGGVWLGAAARATAKVDKVVNQVASEYEKLLTSDTGLAQARKELEDAESHAASASAELQAARQELARAQAEAANATLPAQLLKVAANRIDAETYSKELTTLSLARADLEAMSNLLRDMKRAVPAKPDAVAAASAASKARRAVDRVILYIDDLDRCKPEDVVRVLQLVHMLLAFELFVVVVAVDARWVEEALRKSFPWLSGGDGRMSNAETVSDNAASALRTAGAVTPHDYLEKIFQIAFWLEPMTSARAASYMGSLVPSPVRESGPVTGMPNSGAGTEQPLAVGIAGIELDYMRALAAFAGSSPRRVKRLVNVYRLIKAGMSDAQLRTFLTDRKAEDGTQRSGPYQLVIGLLVIAGGAPTSSTQILEELSQWDTKDGVDVIVDRFRARRHPDWTMAARVIENLIRTQRTQNASELRGWAGKVRRYLLNRAHGERAWEAPGTVVRPMQNANAPVQLS